MNLFGTKPLARGIVLACIIIFAASLAAAQELPDKIRGYKVHKQDIVVSTVSGGDEDDRDAFVKLAEPELVDISITGVTFALSAELKAMEQSGKVDFLTFHDFKVNGISVTINEYDSSFAFKKGEAVVLPEPATIFLPTTRLIQAGWKEARDSTEFWPVTGRVFVFGKFRKFGFNFKRVVPIDIDLNIKNPLYSAKKDAGSDNDAEDPAEVPGN